MTGVLFLCTANVCRSPLAERLLAAQLTSRSASTALPVPLASVGARARPGTGMHRLAADVLIARGADAGGFISRPLTPWTVGNPALVLTAERWHRQAAIEVAPRLLRRSFTILEFDRLLQAGVPDDVLGQPMPGRLVALAEFAASRRGSGALVPPALDDLPDPIGGSLGDFELCADRLEGALAAAAEVLAAPN